jgi:hypothetical protein
MSQDEKTWTELSEKLRASAQRHRDTEYFFFKTRRRLCVLRVSVLEQKIGGYGFFPNLA